MRLFCLVVVVVVFVVIVDDVLFVAVVDVFVQVTFKVYLMRWKLSFGASNVEINLKSMHPYRQNEPCLSEIGAWKKKLAFEWCRFWNQQTRCAAFRQRCCPNLIKSIIPPPGVTGSSNFLIDQQVTYLGSPRIFDDRKPLLACFVILCTVQGNFCIPVSSLLMDSFVKRISQTLAE